MAKTRVFVSFDYDNDRRYKYLLNAWDANKQFDFVFEDATSGAIDSNNVGRVKAALTTKIRSATHTLVIVGKEGNKRHADHQLIGCRNWQCFEAQQSIASGNRLIGVKLDRSYDSPETLIGAGTDWVYGFDEQAIVRALGAR